MDAKELRKLKKFSAQLRIDQLEMFIPILSGRPMMWWTMAWEKKSWTLYPRV